MYERPLSHRLHPKPLGRATPSIRDHDPSESAEPVLRARRARANRAISVAERPLAAADTSAAASAALFVDRHVVMTCHLPVHGCRPRS